MSHLKLIKKKYISYKKQNKKFITLIAIFSFLINLCGFAFLISDLTLLTFKKIDNTLKMEKYMKYWNLLYISGCLILFGYSFTFGHYFFNLIYYVCGCLRNIST